MANSHYEYVKTYEQDDRLLPGCWIVVRLDGRGFTKFCDVHEFEKPNDTRALNLMNAAAMEVMHVFSDIRLAYGESDEYSFVLHKNTTLFERRSSKLLSLIVSHFTAAFVRHWHTHFPPDQPLRATPSFDGRCVLYPCVKSLRDYFSWRQVDTHVNNQYNTCFWLLVKSGMSKQEANATLQGTVTEQKNELMFSQFGINYNTLPEQFRKGTVLVWQHVVVPKPTRDGGMVEKQKRVLQPLHVDIIRDGFWKQHPHVLAD